MNSQTNIDPLAAHGLVSRDPVEQAYLAVEGTLGLCNAVQGPLDEDGLHGICMLLGSALNALTLALTSPPDSDPVSTGPSGRLH